MKPAPFEYHAPDSVAEVVALLAAHGDEAKVLAGGQSLLPILALRLSRYDHLVDVARVSALTGIERRGSTLRLGATTRQRAAERSTEVAASTPLLARALPHIGHVPIRNRGTIGGSIAHADPASELPAVCLALDATVHLASASETRTVDARDFFVGTWTTTARPDELLTAVDVPAWDGRTGFAVEELTRRHGDFALAGVMVGVSVDDAGLITRCAISYLGMDSTPRRADAAEAALCGQVARTVDRTAAAALAVDGLEPGNDIHLSARHRLRAARHLTDVALGRAIEEALA